MALSAVLASAGFAGDCMSCGTAARYGGWDNYCGGDSCGRGNCGCNRCCFPLVQNTLQRLGCVVDLLIPDPCCRRSYCEPVGCGSVGCAQPACGIEPGCGANLGYGPTPAGNPFIDDQARPPTPLPDKGARSRSMMGTPKMTYGSTPTITSRPVTASPKPALKPIPMKTAAAPRSVAKPVINGKAAGKSVLKVGYEESQEEVSDVEMTEADAPPAAPASIRSAREVRSDARFAAKPVVRAQTSQLPANPLR